MDRDLRRPPHRRLWPYWLIVAILLAVLLAVLWLSAEVRRLRERRKYYIPTTESNAPVASTNAAPAAR